MKLNKLNAVLISCLIFFLSACDSGQNNESNTELSAELEELQKELGRLEYRVYQLENPDAENSTADEATDDTVDQSN